MHTFPNFTATAPLPLQNLITVFPDGNEDMEIWQKNSTYKIYGYHCGDTMSYPRRLETFKTYHSYLWQQNEVSDSFMLRGNCLL